MKTSKPALQTSAQEECGVWLDTVQLKVKAKQVIVETRFKFWLNDYFVTPQQSSKLIHVEHTLPLTVYDYVLVIFTAASFCLSRIMI